MKFIQMIVIMNSLMTPMMKHPMTLGLMLMTQTMLMCIYTSNLMKTSWFGYILFITMIGGMMIMFMYMSSIASNEKFETKNSKPILSLMILTMLVLAILMKDQTAESMMKLLESKLTTVKYEEMKITSKFFNKFKANLTIMMMMILLLTMVSVTNICNTFEGPLKNTYV